MDTTQSMLFLSGTGKKHTISRFLTSLGCRNPRSDLRAYTNPLRLTGPTKLIEHKTVAKCTPGNNSDTGMSHYYALLAFLTFVRTTKLKKVGELLANSLVKEKLGELLVSFLEKVLFLKIFDRPMHPFRKGNIVTLDVIGGKMYGIIKDVGFLYSTIRLVNDYEVVLPNNYFTARSVMNSTLSHSILVIRNQLSKKQFKHYHLVVENMRKTLSDLSWVDNDSIHIFLDDFIPQSSSYGVFVVCTVTAKTLEEFIMHRDDVIYMLFGQEE